MRYVGTDNVIIIKEEDPEYIKCLQSFISHQKHLVSYDQIVMS